MAMGDYYRCDKCQRKAIYDADIFDRWEQAGSMAIICTECAADYVCVVVKRALPVKEPAARVPDREAVAMALAKALKDGKLYGTVTMGEYIEPIEKIDLSDWGIPWPEHPYDRAAFIREAQIEIMAGVLADAAIAAMQETKP